MANGHGGYRAPANPAPVSGPGQLSRRTDGQPIQRLSDAQYGEQKEFREIQQGAPVSRGAPIDTSRVVPFTQGSQRPNEPVTAGMAPVQRMDEGDLLRLRTYIKPLKFLASLPGASAATRQLVRQLQGAQ